MNVLPCDWCRGYVKLYRYGLFLLCFRCLPITEQRRRARRKAVAS